MGLNIQPRVAHSLGNCYTQIKQNHVEILIFHRVYLQFKNIKIRTKNIGNSVYWKTPISIIAKLETCHFVTLHPHANSVSQKFSCGTNNKWIFAISFSQKKDEDGICFAGKTYIKNSQLILTQLVSHSIRTSVRTCVQKRVRTEKF